MKWPFREMVEGETRYIGDHPPEIVARAAHNYGRSKGWKFKTRTINRFGKNVSEVTRLFLDTPKTARTAQDRAIDPKLTYKANDGGRYTGTYPFERLEVGASMRFTQERHGAVLGRIISAVYRRGKARGRIYTLRSHIENNAYVWVEVTRTV